MKTIMFVNDIYGQTDAVISGAKTQDVRLATASQLKKILGLPNHADFNIDELAEGCQKDQYALSLFAPYAKGEEVAIAQPLSEIEHNEDFIRTQIFCKLDNIDLYIRRGKKKYIRADLFPHRIRINNVRLARLQDISDEDCLKEGISISSPPLRYMAGYWRDHTDIFDVFDTPREAFSALVNKTYGKGKWERNPYVFIYDFELIKKSPQDE